MEKMMIGLILGCVTVQPIQEIIVNDLIERFVLAPVAFKLANGPGSAEEASSIASKFGRIIQFDKSTGNWIVDVDGSATIHGTLQALRSNPRVASATPVVPELDHSFPFRNRTDVLEKGLKLYEKRYQEFLKVAPPRADGTPWKKTAPRQSALGSQLWRLQRRAFPNKTIDMGAYRKAAWIVDNAPEATIVPMGGLEDISTTFTSVGPRNLTPHSRNGFGLGDVSGRVNDIAVDPTNSLRWFAATAGGGIWRTTDGGVNWTPLSDDWPGLNVSSVTIDPTDPDVIYAGGGDIPNLYVPVFRTPGLQKSIDGGTTWTRIGSGVFGDEPISDILVHPETPNIVIVATARVYDGNGSAQAAGKIYRSLDGGSTWSIVVATAGNYFSLAVSSGPSGSRRIYCSTNSGVLRSTNSGASWNIVHTSSATQSEVDAGRTSTGAVYYANSSGSILRSTDYGDTWASIATGLSGAPGYSSGQSWYNLALGIGRRTTVAPFTTDLLYLGHIDSHFSSSSGGNEWFTLGGPAYSETGLMHVDTHVIEQFPQNGLKMLVGNDGGVYELTYNTSTQNHTVANRSADFVISQIYAADYHPTNTGIVLAGAQDNGSPNANGNLNDWRTVTGYDGGFPVIYQTNPNIQFTSRQGLGMSSSPAGVKLFRTTDNWATNTEINGPTPASGETVNFIAPVVRDPNNTNNIYLGTNYLYRYRVDTNTFSSRLGNQAFGGSLESIAIAPGNDSCIYVGTNNGRIWRSLNSGANWTELSTTALPDRSINSIAVHPNIETEILVGLGGTGAGPVYRCSNTNAPTWVNESGTIGRGVLPQVNANTVMYDPFDPNFVMYVGTDLGLFRTTEGGGYWERFGDTSGLPNVEVTDLDYVEGTNYLMVATFGRGIFRTKLPESVFPSSMTIVGASSTGVLADIFREDQSQVEVFPTYPTRETGLTIQSTSPVQTPLEFDIILRSSHVGSGNVMETIELFDWTANQWVAVSGRPLNGFTQSTPVVISLNGNTANYIQSGTRIMRARVRVSAVKNGQGDWNYRHRIGEFHFRIVR